MPVAEDCVEIEQLMEKVAKSERSALLLDYDGTLAPFVVDRRKAFPYPGVVPTLQEIMASGRSRVIIVTGRSAPEVVALLGIHPHPEIWGGHGLEYLSPDGVRQIPPLSQDVSTALAEAEVWLATERVESLAEHKPGSIAVHWRGLSQSKALEIRERVLRGWFQIAEHSQMSILEFDGGVEMRVRALDKGDVVRKVAREMKAEAPIAYLGDDVTDERAFEALGSRGLSVLVRPAWRRTSAQIWFRPPHELLDFLIRWMDACYGLRQPFRRMAYE
ncbi:MAG: trehalose-phosphatase [Terriglobales bacterium]